MSRPKSRILSFFLLLFALAALLAVSAAADSHVRIVRLSYIEGGVQISRGEGQAYEKAMTNLPIAEGAKLRTSDDGRAEVEFEDGSTLRIVPGSTVEFLQLSLRDSGAKASQINVTQGTAYVAFAGTKNDEFSVEFGNEKVALTHAAHLRIDMRESPSLAVFKGLVQVEGPSGAIEVKKNQTVSFDLAENGQYKLAKNIHQEPFDSWDDQQNEYHTRYAAKSYNSYSPYAYGTTDLAYYGNFFNYPGYGMMWQPYFAGAGWDPFMDGAWAFNQGFGFGWVSAYPWGWTPYHYGTWVFLPGNGWAWQPGGVWTTWYSRPVLRNAPQGFVAPQAPTNGTHTVLVSRGTASTFSGSKVVLRNNSAGMGVPRGEVENMAKLSQKTQQRGVVTQRIAQPVAISSSSSVSGSGGTRVTSHVGRPTARPSGISIPSGGSHASSGGSPHR